MASSNRPQPYRVSEQKILWVEATTGYVKLKKDGALMFCKRYRVIGSNIATIQCLSEGEMRTQVDDMTKYRDDMRNRSGRCTLGPGCAQGN